MNKQDQGVQQEELNLMQLQIECGACCCPESAYEQCNLQCVSCVNYRDAKTLQRTGRMRHISELIDEFLIDLSTKAGIKNIK